MAANQRNEIDARTARATRGRGEQNPAADMGENKGTSRTGKGAAGKGQAPPARDVEAAGKDQRMAEGARGEADSNVDTDASADLGTLIHEME